MLSPCANGYTLLRGKDRCSYDLLLWNKSNLNHLTFSWVEIMLQIKVVLDPN
jgi:hypothetical protein